MDCYITHIGTATILLQMGSIRLLTDPVFDPPGGRYHFGYGTSSQKLTAPTIRAEDIGKLYISGDTVWFNGIHEIAHRFQVGTAVLHIGKARFPITGPIHFTFSAKEAVRAVKALNPRTIVPIHYEGWKHFREPKAEAEKQFAAAGIKERVRWLPLGEPVPIEI